MKQAFDHCADDYARYRPRYPDGLFAVLADLLGPEGGPVADVGAGTGIFAGQLAGRGWRVIAIEPSAAMLRHVRSGGGGAANLGAVRPLCATAEATALAGGSVAMVTAAQAFHWFNPPYALAEFARVLQPDGVLALAWNNREAAGSAFVEAYEDLITQYNPRYQREYRQQDWPAKMAASGAFTPAQYRRFDHVWTASADGMVGFSRSVSYIRNVLSREQWPRFEEDLRATMRRHFGQGPCEIPMRTDLWIARRI
ncbi:MAG: class I SAM-dependent methyltransferase [bacterium]|nr:class I SAM-dependent methyltransferase [bacterium]